jgi:alkane 1-monooxygenase
MGNVFPYFLGVLIIYVSAYFDLNYKNMMMGMFLYYVISPIIDTILPLDHYNLPDKVAKVYEKDKRFLVPLYTVWTLDFLIYFNMLYEVSIGNCATTSWTFVLYAFAYASLGGMNATVGHELVHHREAKHKVMGTLAFAKMLYPHYFIQHVRGHHKEVGTYPDASTARLNESVYKYLI